MKNVKKLPYQYSFTNGKDSVTLERHALELDPLLDTRVTGITVNKVTVYTDGSVISKIEYEVYTNSFNSGFWDRVTIVDPSPTAETTDNIIFTHTANGKLLTDKKTLGEVKNTTAFPVRNQLKENYLLPSALAFYDAFLFTAEIYYKSFQDGDTRMSQFLKENQR
jgi:hypothetical protein